MNSKFLPLESFGDAEKAGYSLLPFRFTKLDSQRYVLSNLVGEYLVAGRDIVNDLIEHELSSNSEEYRDLKSLHFLEDGDSDIAVELLALKQRTKLQQLANFTALHMFVVSLRCEHSCPYCQVSRQSDDTSAFDMSIETADKSLDLVFASPSPSIKIEFQGGEPLLNFPLIQHVVQSAEARNTVKNRDLQFVIATNLALIDDEILTFCDNHSILISTSLDGPEDLHNANRPRPGGDSYQRTIEGIRRCRTQLGRDRVSALMTTSPASMGRVRDIIDEYLKHDFEGIFLRALSPYGFAVRTRWYEQYKSSEWTEFYFEGLDYIIDLNMRGIPFVEHFASVILTKMLTPFDTGYVDLMSPSGIGIAATVYNYDGDVYAADEGRMLAEMDDKTFRLGNVHESTYSDIYLSDQLLDPIEQSFANSVPMCVDCAFEPYCGSDPVFHHATQNDFVGNKAKSQFCHRNMAIFRGLIERMEANKEVKDVFLRWVSR